MGVCKNEILGVCNKPMGVCKNEVLGLCNKSMGVCKNGILGVCKKPLGVCKKKKWECLRGVCKKKNMRRVIHMPRFQLQRWFSTITSKNRTKKRPLKTEIPWRSKEVQICNIWEMAKKTQIEKLWDYFRWNKLSIRWIWFGRNVKSLFCRSKG